MFLGSISCTGYWVTLWRSHGDKLISAITSVLVILVGYWVVRFFVFRLISRLIQVLATRAGGSITDVRGARVRALQTVLKSAVGFILAFVAIVMILQAAGINIVPLITTASVAGLAIGFGAQKLVRDVISGFFILAEDQYGVGDYVTIGTAGGVVEDLGMRVTRLRDLSGRLYILSNGDITQVCNHSRGTLRLSQDVVLSASCDLTKAMSVLNEVGEALAKEMPSQIKEPFKCEGLAQISGATATIRITGGVLARHQDEVQMALNARIREEFEKNGIQLA